MSKKYILLLLLILVTFLSTAQNRQTDSITDYQTKVKNLDFTVMPFISYNRNLKFMIGAMPMVMYKLDKQDTISPKSLSGVVGVYTTNKSYVASIFNKFYFDEDNWRGTLFIAFGDINSQFFTGEFESADFYNYGTDATMFSAGIKRKIVNKLYGGITYTYASYNTVFEDNIADESITVTHGLELNLLYDSRDNVYYPTTGNKINIKWINYPEWFGNEAEANKIKATYNRYVSMREKKDVLAMRFSGILGLGSIAFEQQTVVGGTDIRGYSEGKYRGDAVMAVQGEYRYNMDRFGLVGFVGVATLFGSDTDSFNGDLLPGGGVGIRYQAFKENRFNIGLDGALGKDDWGIYFRIGEAF